MCAVPPRSSPPASPITARAVGIGLFATVLIGLLSAYNDCFLNNSYFIANHFPAAAIVVVAFLVLAVNTAARRFLGLPGFSSAELLLIWGIVGIGGSLSAYAFPGYFAPFVAAPAYLTTESNQYRDYILNHMPEWMVVSRDPDSPALKWFMEGLPKGGRIPWGEWAGPIAAWCGFALVLYASNFALCAMFFRQWSERERLVFPIVHVPEEVSREAPPGRLLNDFFRSRLTWIGIAIPILIWTVKGLRAYSPEFPDIPLKFGTWGLFSDLPWNQFNMSMAEVWFAVLGISFLLTREVSFSFWFFFVVYRLSYVYVAWIGGAGSGFFGNWHQRVSVFETAGGMLAVTVFLCWTARRYLAGWLRRAAALETDPGQDSLPPWLSLALIAGGGVLMTGWYVLAGAQPWVGALAVALNLAMLLVLTRIVAESGLLMLGGITEPFRFITQLFPAGWLSGASLVSLAMQRGINNEDMRKVFMPYVINGMKAGERGRMRMGKVLAVFGVAAVVGTAAGSYGFIATSHKHGAVNVDWWGAVLAPKYYLDDVANRQKNPPDFDMMRAGDREVFPVNLAHLLLGGAFAGGLFVLRALFPWWPLHPFGFVMCATWAMSRIWFSVFLGWLAKSCVMSFGGAKVYQRALPLFLGFALGECLIGAFWMVMGVVTGVVNIPMVP